MLTLDSISIRYERKEVVHNVSFSVKQGEVVSIIGPNGSGKSTILKAITGFISSHTGTITFEQKEIQQYTTKQIAQNICMLSQKNQAPNDMLVKDLVAYGRYPHKKWFERLNHEDQDIVHWSLEKTHLADYKDRMLASLSGGEAQRAWIAMALAQRPKLLLLDEPTTYLDIAHQHEVLELVRELNEDMGITVMMVLHDLNQASRYSNHLIVVQNGRKIMEGTPTQVMTSDMLRDVYNMEAEVVSMSKEEAPRIHLLNTIRQK